MKNSDFVLSVIIPVYNEEKNIEVLIKKLFPILKPYDFEIIFINDGSTDQTENIIKKIAKKDKKIKLVSFVRNFGHQMALTAGYNFAKGDCIVSIDADLQDPPELITKMVQQWKNGSKIVYAKRIKREEDFFKKTTAYIFYWFINVLSDTPIPKDVGDFRLLDKEVVVFLNKLPERARFLRGLVSWGGFPSSSVTFIRKKRLYGKTHYPLSKMLSFALEGITSFSTKPLKLATYLGFMTSIIGFLGILYALVQRLFLPHYYWVTGWTAIFVAITFFGGVQLLSLGIIGEYIGKIYKEVQSRPQYLIKDKINLS